jgi:hypothetical protein
LNDISDTSSAPWGAQSGGSYLSFPLGWLALFGPRPSLPISAPRKERDWQQWDVGETHHGMAVFYVAPDGKIDKEPIKAIPRKKPCQVSSRQWEGR